MTSRMTKSKASARICFRAWSPREIQVQESPSISRLSLMPSARLSSSSDLHDVEDDQVEGLRQDLLQGLVSPGDPGAGKSLHFQVELDAFGETELVFRSA